MKKAILISIIPILALLLFIAAQSPSTAVQPVSDDIELGWPDDVMSILERSCFDCHSADAGNIKAKGALNFSKWEGYKLTKKINKFSAISEEVKEKGMPPGKYIKDYPEKALNDDEIKLIVDWANTEADKLIEE